MKDELLRLIVVRAFRYSEEPVFRLASGRMSNYYFNCKAVTLHPMGMYLIGSIVFEMIRGAGVQAIGGLTLGADPIAVATAYTSYIREAQASVEAFVVRKTAKAHGTMQWIEGNVSPGDRVVIVDDVITTGGSTIDAVTKAREAGLTVVEAIALIDRQEGGREAIEGLGIPLRSIVTRDEVMEFSRRPGSRQGIAAP